LRVDKVITLQLKIVMFFGRSCSKQYDKGGADYLYTYNIYL